MDTLKLHDNADVRSDSSLTALLPAGREYTVYEVSLYHQEYSVLLAHMLSTSSPRREWLVLYPMQSPI